MTFNRKIKKFLSSILLQVFIFLTWGAKVVPAALNSGVFWGKGTPKKPGKITLEFLEPINPGLSKQEFMAKLESVIEKKSNELLEKARRKS